jgi:S1-C subfamily serine protease
MGPRYILQLSGSSRACWKRSTVRVAIRLCLAAMVWASLGYAYAQNTDDSLRIYAVNIIRHPTEPWIGVGVYLGKGLVLTAAHVVGSASRTNPSVRIAGLDLPAQAIKEGSVHWGVDLTLLSIDEQKLPASLRMRRMPLCETSPRVGDPVIVAIPERTARSRIMSPQLLPPNVRTKFPTVISDVATTGNSGSGVFDAGRKCLLGIMSRKFSERRPNSSGTGSEQKDIAKYFVPASAIRAFIPADHPF